MKRVAIILCLLFGATACIVKPYTAPTAQSIKLDSLYRYATDTSNNVGQTPWREVFRSEPLRALIDSVLANNLDQRIALLRVGQNYSALRSARASIAPSVGASASYPTLNVGLTMNWEIDLWGKLYANKEAAKAQFWQSQEIVNASRSSLVAATAMSYYQLMVLDAKRKVIIETIDNRTQYLATTLALKESGKVNEVAVQQAISQLTEVKAAMPLIEMSIAKTENALALLAGRTTMNFVREKAVNLENENVVVAAGYPAQLLSFRPDVRAAEMNYRSKHYLHMASRAALYPSLQLSLEGGVSDIIGAHNVVLSALAGLTQPIFNGRKLRANKEIAQAEAQIAELQFKNTLFTAVNEVNDALISIQSNDLRVKSQVLQLAALKKAYEYSQELFVNGYATYLDVLVAQTGVYNAQMNLIDSFLDSLYARIDLYRAVGGGSDGEVATPVSAPKCDPVLDGNRAKKESKKQNSAKTQL